MFGPDTWPYVALFFRKLGGVAVVSAEWTLPLRLPLRELRPRGAFSTETRCQPSCQPPLSTLAWELRREPRAADAEGTSSCGQQGTSEERGGGCRSGPLCSIILVQLY